MTATHPKRHVFIKATGFPLINIFVQRSVLGKDYILLACSFFGFIPVHVIRWNYNCKFEVSSNYHNTLFYQSLNQDEIHLLLHLENDIIRR